MGAGEVFYSPMIRSRTFSETVPLDCELQKCFPVFSTSLGVADWLKWARIGYFPFPPNQLGCLIP